MSIKIDNLTYIYNEKTPFEKKAIDNITLSIKEGEFIGLIGHTGSGKSTFIQHLNGLIKPTSGKIYIDDVDITNKKVLLKDIRKKVGLVFQYPEHQLFEETIYKDIAFGPKNLGLSDDEIHERVIDSMTLVGLDVALKDRSPFELSGGQKRRVAIAGVLAMNPKILILDEPTAGLDPKGRDTILELIKEFYKKKKITIIIVSHSMEDIAKIVDRVLVMSKGKLYLDGTPREIFKKIDELEAVGLAVPQVTYLIRELIKKGKPFREDIITVNEAKEELLKYLRSKKND